MLPVCLDPTFNCRAPGNPAVPLGTCNMRYGPTATDATSTSIVSPCTSTAILLTATLTPSVAGAKIT
jgi:hypothetical protein